MDQLKEQLANAAKFGFWIGTAILLLGSLGVWWVVTGTLNEENASRSSRITSDAQKVQQVRGELSTHPNAKSHEVMEALIKSREDEVLKAWQTVFDEQTDILVWPVEELKKDFVAKYEGKIPIEVHMVFGESDDDVEPNLLKRYSNYIGDVLPKIAEIAKAEWTAEFDGKISGGAAGGMGMGMGGMEMEMGMGMGMDDMMTGAGARVGVSGAEEGPLVEWPSSAQSALLGELFPWKGRRPTALEIYYSQENLWILRQMLKIVADVNGEATQPFQAKIHRIDQLSMGRKVKFTNGNISSPGMGAMGGMGMGMDDMMMDEMGMGMDMDMMGMEMGMGTGMGSIVEALDPADNRYVDTLMQPITGDTLRSALNSESPTDAPLKVAKRVPVMMKFKMNQRSVPELLAACGNAPLMVQVIQTRVLPPNAASSPMGGGMGMEMEMGMGEMGMGDMGMGGMGMGGTGMGGAAAANQDPFPLDVTVEVYGLIHIYNPPDRSKLGVEQVNADTIAEGETLGAQTPAPTPEAALPAPATPDTATPTTPTPAAPAPSDGNIPATQPAAVDPNATNPGTPNPTAPPPNVTPPPADAAGSPVTAPATAS